MQGLAVATGMSRQLIYEHFVAADELYLATLNHLFERSYATVAAVLGAGSSLDQTVRAAFAVFLDLPAEERHALRALAAEADPGRRGLDRARMRLRKRIAGLWVPYVSQQTALPEAEAVALAWMLNTAAWGLSDTIADGTLERSRALDLFVGLVESALSSQRAMHRRETSVRRRPLRRPRPLQPGRTNP
jgi:AcrR family transcriptional regulator